jgi:hypothetical protein
LFIPGQKYVVYISLINPEKFHKTSLHIELGLVKNFVKTMDQNSAGFMYWENKFPRISDAKTKDGLFFGPRIRELIQYVQYED